MIKTSMMTGIQEWSKTLLLGVLLAPICLVAIMAFVSSAPSTEIKAIRMALNMPLLNTLAAAMLIFAAHRSAKHARRTSQAWGLLAIAQTVLAIGGVATYVRLLGFDVPEFLIYAIYLFSYPLMLFGFLYMPAKRLTWIAWSKVALDLTIVLLAGTLIIWHYWLGPLMVSASEEGVSRQLLALVFPVGHLMQMWALLMLLHRRSPEQQPTPLYLLLFGVGLSLVSDFNFGYQHVVGTYQLGSWLDFPWIAATLCIILAGLWQATASHADHPIAKNAKRGKGLLTHVNSWLTYLPYAGAGAAFIIQQQRQPLNESGNPFWLSVDVGMIIGLVMIRQILTLYENKQLVTQVRQQALDLQAEVNDRKRAEAQLAHDVLHDALTGLPNRVLFMNQLRRNLELAKRQQEHHFSVLFLDLDHFKLVNDSLGHAYGDQLLIEIAQRLRLSLRTGDVVARLSGDEFVVLLKDAADAAQAANTANRLEEALKQPFDLHGRQFFASASIGIVAAAHQYTRAEEILRDADIAMYEAKAQGKAGHQIFNITMREQAQKQLAMENDLHAALKQDELALDYQPILSLQTGSIIGFEALLRWRHPQHGLIPPADFIPIAEETGLIAPIGQWVLHEACRQLREWQGRFPQNPPLTMSVNISAVQFAAPTFVEQLTEILQVVALDPATLRLELTESVWLKSTTEASAIFGKLNSMGIQLHIDDFGTGYSSLAYLQQFPIRVLKIDRAFLNKMSDDNNKDLIRAVIAMAHDLGMEAVAEGVETTEQLNTLKQFGCNYGQGYLLSRPVNKAGVEAFIQRSRLAQTTAPQQQQSPFTGAPMLTHRAATG